MTDVQESVEDHFPRLAQDGYRLTSSPTDEYNCVAWVVRDIRRWWQPDLDGAYWPEALEDDSLDGYIAMFREHGFEECGDPSVSPGVEKIAIYGKGDEFFHVAYQREDGRWSSKLGKGADIRHDSLSSLEGPATFRELVTFMERPREPHPLADSGLLALESPHPVGSVENLVNAHGRPLFRAPASESGPVLPTAEPASPEREPEATDDH